ncbi:hypothetical protein [Actimicrobium antarcticum]|uniref:Uncharacterized protein n=1 Tax=Actimicrobium antarcticum TaxID=1051899 RepID=A0ABP7SXS9_9BURK
MPKRLINPWTPQREAVKHNSAEHKDAQRRAGLPILPGKVDEPKSYAARLFNFSAIGALPQANAIKTLQDPALEVGEAFDIDAMEENFRITQDYRYFLQEWGEQA